MKKGIELLSIEKISKRTKMPVEEVENFLNLVKRSMEPFSMRVSVTENGVMRYYLIERRGLGILETEYGKFWEYSFVIDDCWEKYSVIVKADLDEERLVLIFKKKDEILLRTDSGCETSQVFGDLTCDCREQLHFALKTIQEAGEGLVINIPRQDGRGMGLTFKLATLWMQDVLKVNTVESATLLAPGGIIDIRTYSGIVGILKFFGITENCKVNLATNNPDKAGVFAENGYTVVDYTPIVIKPNKHTKIHLKAKQKYLGHKGLVQKRRKK